MYVYICIYIYIYMRVSEYTRIYIKNCLNRKYERCE